VAGDRRTGPRHNLHTLKVLVTGGSGFIGSTVVDALIAHGRDVYVVDDLSMGRLPNLDEARREGGVKFHRYDIASEAVGDLLQQVRPEVVLHLAAQASVPASVADPVNDAQVNIIGLLRVLDASVAAGVSKFVFASSGGTIYGTQTRLPIRESATGRPVSPYGITKRAAEDYLRFYESEFGLEFMSLALANVYGPRQDAHGEGAVVAAFATNLVRGQTPVIHGTGEQTRDFVYVEDVAHAFVRACEEGSGETVNISTGIETSINDLYDVMARAVQFEHEARRGPARAGDLFRSALDPSRAAKVLDWRPWTSLPDGLQRTLAWFRLSAK
jgi:UDP-glucose 4-epimerase